MYHLSSVIPVILPHIIPYEYQCFLLLFNLISEVGKKALCYDWVEISAMAENQHFLKVFKKYVCCKNMQKQYIDGSQCNLSSVGL